jgi:transcriptional regulator with XRE-family HTH domain
MLAEGLTAYESWDLEKPSIPDRSRLYQLEPIGIGTPFVESLTGYISRLAETHCVLSGMLVLGEIALLVKEGYTFQGKDGGINKVFGHDTRNLNGTGSAAVKLVRATEALTLRQDLRFLTLLTWAKVIPQRDLPKKHRAWCPACYEQWQVKGEAIYEPLLWSLKAVTICPHHHQPLHEECPHCHHKSVPLAWRSQPGYCSKCSGWLGAASSANEMDSGELKWQLWVVNQIGALLSFTPQLLHPLPTSTIQKIISVYIDQVTEGNLAAFARLIEMPKSTVHQWHRGKAVPSLDTLLKLCYRFGISLTDFLVRDVVVDSLQKVALARLPFPGGYRHQFDKDKALQELNKALEEIPPPSMTEVQKRLGYKTYSTLYERFPDLCAAISQRCRDYKSSCQKEKLRGELEAVLNSDECPPPSLKEVARRLGYSTTTFYSNFPELSYVIANRYTSYLNASHAELITRLVGEARQSAISLHNERIKPTDRRVAERLTKPGAILQKEVRAALRELRQELGWEK